MIGAVKGFNDIRPRAKDLFLDSTLWERLFGHVRDVMAAYAYEPVWLPLVEQTELFTHGLGTETDIVAKEMYSFTDRGDRAISLRPEGTAGAVRAYIEHHLPRNEPVQRWYYAGPMFRAERPQKGRYRQFYQVGAELFGSADPSSDVEMVLLLQDLCGRLGLKDVHLKLNTLGDAQSRLNYRGTLGAFLKEHRDALCATCQVRADNNPLRVLDCKNPSCKALLQNAPDILDALSDASKAWFDRYIALLDAHQVPYTRDRMLVRGLDYYSDVIFEMTTGALGAQDAILGGGRYNGLVESLGGAPTPAVGFAAGVERLALLMAQQAQPLTGPDVSIALQDAQYAGMGLLLAQGLRVGHGLNVELDTAARGVKHAMRRADKQHAATVVVIGADEAQSQQGVLKRLRDGEKITCPLQADAVAAACKKLSV